MPTSYEEATETPDGVLLGTLLDTVASQMGLAPVSLLVSAWACLLRRLLREDTLTIAVVDGRLNPPASVSQQGARILSTCAS